METLGIPTYEDFMQAMAPWFAQVQLPPALQRRLYYKLEHGLFDSGEAFELCKVPMPNDSETENAEWTSTSGEEDVAEHDTAESDQAEDGSAALVREASGAAAALNEEDEDETPALRPGHVLLVHRDLAAFEDVWLIDHAITFTDLDELAARLSESSALCDRLEELIRLPPLPDPAAGLEVASPLAPPLNRARARERVKRLLSHMWKGVDSYALPRADGAAPQVFWFFRDEVGSALMPFTDGDLETAAETPMMRLEVMPLALPPSGIVFSVMWATTDLAQNQIVGRKANYNPRWMTGTPHKHQLLDEPTCNRVLAEVLYGSPGTRIFAEAVEACLVSCTHERIEGEATPVSGPVLPTPGARQSAMAGRTQGSGLKLYTDNTAVTKALRGDSTFELVTSPRDAEVVWITHTNSLVARSAGGAKKGFPSARVVSSFPHLSTVLASPATWGAWMREHIDITSETASCLPVVYTSTPPDLCALTGHFLLRELFLLYTREAQGIAESEPPSAVVQLAGRYVTPDNLEGLRCPDGINSWLCYAMPDPAAVSADANAGDADGTALALTSDLPALLKMAEPRAMVYLKNQVNTLRLPDFAARQVTIKVFLAVRAVATATSPADVVVYNECVAVLKPDAYASSKYVEDAEKVSQLLASLTTPYTFVGRGAPVKQALWLNAAALVDQINTHFASTSTPNAWALAQARILHTLRTAVAPLVTQTTRPENLDAADLSRRRTLLSATFVLGQDMTNGGIQPILVGLRDGMNYASVHHVCPSALPALLRAAILHENADMTPL